MLALVLVMAALQDVPSAPASTFVEVEALPGQVVTHVGWLTTPIPRFPREAMRGQVRAGTVRLSCIVTVQGRFRNCEITEETPPGFSFGREALAAVRAVRLTPRTIDSRPVETHVQFSVGFRRSGP